MNVRFSGGFHNRPGITIRLSFSPKFRLPETWGPGELKDYVVHSLSRHQREKLEKHFCGVRGCSCGSWTRAEMKIVRGNGP